ncbi:MAG: hypothetical protein R3B84_21710 [Zavarzinella sp.]
MEQSFRHWLIDNNEGAIDDAFFNEECLHFFAIDWREDAVDIVQDCAGCLNKDKVQGEWQNDRFVIIRNGIETSVPLLNDDADRDITIRTLNNVLSPDYEIRFLVCSHGSDTAGFAVLSSSEWHTLESELPEVVDANFIKLSAIPNIFSEMTDEQLPPAALARFQRTLERNQNG